MNQIEAQKKIIESIKANPENVIAKALAFNPSMSTYRVAFANVVSAAKLAPCALEVIAYIACRSACNGSDNGKTIWNLLKFADTL